MRHLFGKGRILVENDIFSISAHSFECCGCIVWNHDEERVPALFHKMFRRFFRRLKVYLEVSVALDVLHQLSTEVAFISIDHEEAEFFFPVLLGKGPLHGQGEH